MEVSQQSPLLRLPDELLNIVFAHLPLDTFLACQLTCKRLNNLSSEKILWRRLCLAQYSYWKPERDIEELTDAPPASINWKKLLAERKRIDQSVVQILDGVIASQPGRIGKVEKITSHGYDAKDALLKQLKTPDDAEDVLARRFWASEALGALERSVALDIWSRLHSDEEVPLEHALGAFDIMLLQRPPETLDQISRHLDLLAEQFKTEAPDHEEMEPKLKARMLASYLIDKRITRGNIHDGGHTEEAFRRFQNTLISVALCDDNHPSIPIISVAIFCCIARRIGLDAHPCAFPVRVLAMVFPSAPAEGESQTEAPNQEPFYLDVYNTVSSISLSGLRQQLQTWGIAAAQHGDFLRPASTTQIVERNARNIQESIQVSREHEVVLSKASPEALDLLFPHEDPSDRDPAALRTSLHPSIASYTLAWYNIFSPAHRTHPNVLMVTLTHLKSAVREHYPLDVPLFTKHAQRFFAENDEPDRARAVEVSMRELRDREALPPPLQPRTPTNPGSDKVAYHVGQVLTHRRYGYSAVITGWDSKCEAGDRWIASNAVDGLPGGREQCFYHVLASDESFRYVAEENIQIEGVPDYDDPASGGRGDEEAPIPRELMRLAGKFFRRWDGRKREFVSNVRDQYPDD